MKDLQNRSALDILRTRSDLHHELQLVQDIVDRLQWKEQDVKMKNEVRYRARRGADGGDALKGWVLNGATGTTGVAIVKDHRDGPRSISGSPVKLLDLLTFRHGSQGSPSNVIGWMSHSEPVEFDDAELNLIELVRRATPAELEKAGYKDGGVVEVQSCQISVRYSDVDRSTAYTTYSFDVCIGDTCVHTISDRYSALEKKYGKLGRQTKSKSLLNELKEGSNSWSEHMPKFPGKQNKLAAKMSEDLRQKAEITRKQELKHFFEGILDIEGKMLKHMSPEERSSELERVHKTFGMSDEVSKRLSAVAEPESTPVTRDSVKLDRTEESSRGVRAELEKALVVATRSIDLKRAATIAMYSQAAPVLKMADAVTNWQLKTEVMEQKRADARWSADYYKAHERASMALENAKSSIADEKYEEAIAELDGGLHNDQSQRHVTAYSDDAGMMHRWDLEAWLKVAQMRKCMQNGVVSDTIRVLEEPRKDNRFCWSLDISGGLMLVDAVSSLFSSLGVGQDSGSGMLQLQRDSLIKDIETMIEKTRLQVDDINSVLYDLHTELLRLAEFPAVPVVQHEGEPAVESGQTEPSQQTARSSISLTQLQIEAMEPSYRHHWPVNKDVITVQELGGIMQDMQGHYFPSELELKSVDVSERGVDYVNYLKVCSQQLDTSDTELLEVFQIFDADGDGQISAPDLRQVLISLSIGQGSWWDGNLPDAVINEMMQEGDTNDDAHIDWAEFKAMMHSRECIDCSGLESTLQKALQLTGRTDNVHHSLPALYSTTQAISAISRFCGYAAYAKANRYVGHGDAYGEISLESTCAGSELWSLVVVKLIISSSATDTLRLPTVSFALPGNVMFLPGEPNVNDDLDALALLLDLRMADLAKELGRRSCVRLNVVAGETALDSRRASEALRHFEHASENATKSEQTQLRDCTEKGTIELKRQEEVKNLHMDAIYALAHGNGARTAVARYASALRSEIETTFEHQALQGMHKLAIEWVAGDDALAQWQGVTAKRAYEEAERANRRVAAIMHTEGYHGGAICLGEDAVEELQKSIIRAQEEIARKILFENTMKQAEVELKRLRAGDAKITFGNAHDIAQGGPESESVDSKDGIDRSREELARQKDVSDLFEQAMTAIRSCVPTKEWEQEDFVDRWTEMSDCVEDAIERCKEAWQSILSVSGRLQSQQDTPEHKALTHMIQACTYWKAGGEHMAAYEGKAAMEDFQAAKMSSDSAQQAKATPGYYGRPLTLREDEKIVLAECIAGADREISRDKKIKRGTMARQSMMGAGAASDALGEGKRLLSLAKTTQEIAEANQAIEAAENEKARQEKVKELHKSGTSALKQNDPDSALKWYTEALQIEVLKEGGRPEANSLERMKEISELWIKGNAALQAWDGEIAVKTFEQCRATEKILDEIVQTRGYAGSKIQLNRATAELQRCEGRAQAETERNGQFTSLIKEGDHALDAWKAEHALDRFRKADDKEHAGYILKYQVAQQDVVRLEKSEEHEIARECIARAEAEVARQNDVKMAFELCVQALAENTAECDTEFDKSPAKERCKGAATTRAADACELAISHALSEKGTLQSQVATPEHSALASLQQLVTAWKTGDEKLAAWDGKAAMVEYQTADTHRENAAETMRAPTVGYVMSSSVKIQLNTDANDALQRCIEEANKEIQRKVRFDDHIKVGQDHLEGLRATQAQDRFAQANKMKMNEEENVLVKDLLNRATQEEKRQIAVKRSFFEGRDLLGSPLPALVAARTPNQDRDLSQELESRHSNIKRHIDDAIQHVLSNKGNLKSQQNKPEYNELMSMSLCAGNWKSGDMALAKRDGPAALGAYERANECARQAKATTATPGYAGKIIELGTLAEALESCIQHARKEIARRHAFDATISRGNHQKGSGEIGCLQEDRVAAHLMIPKRSMCRHADCMEPHIAHAGICNECVSCKQALSPSTAMVHGLDAAMIFANAYGQAMSLVEKDGAIASISTTVYDLEEMLQTERNAYTSLADKAYAYFEDAHDDTLGAQQSYCERGPDTTLAALRALAEWRCSSTGDPLERITAEQIRKELQDALTALEDMHGSNDSIRAMDRQKIKSEDADDGSALGGLDTFEEGDEEEDSDAEEELVPQSSAGGVTTKLQSVILVRTEQRERAIELGDTFSATAEELLKQNIDVEYLCRDVRLGLLGLRRLRRHLNFFGQQSIDDDRHSLLRAWLVAGASESLTEDRVGQPPSKTLKRYTAKLKHVQSVKSAGFFSKSRVTVLHFATVRLNGTVVEVTTHPTADDARLHNETETSHKIQLTLTTRVEAAHEQIVDTRKDALNQIKEGVDKNKVYLLFSFKIVATEENLDDDSMVQKVHLVAGSQEEQEWWIDVIKNKVELLRAGAQLELVQLLPEPEENTVEVDCLQRCQEKAREAIEKYQLWEASLSHVALHNKTDDRISQLRNLIATCTEDVNWITAAEATALEIERCLDDLIEDTRAERGLRELRPMDSLRAALWGVGEHYPQLSMREVMDTSGRYMLAQNRRDGTLSSDLREAQRSFRDIADGNLRTAVLGLVGDTATSSFFELAASSAKLLCDELASLEVTKTSARDNSVSDEVNGANAARTSGCPDTSEFDRLEEQRFIEKEAFDDVLHVKVKLEERADRYDRNHKNYPALEERQQVEQNVRDARRALRATTQLINKEMTKLAEAGSDHWPEVLVNLPSVGEFKKMDFLRSGDLSIDSYEDVMKLEGKGRNEVYTAKLDGKNVVLKAYDLTKADEISNVVQEVTQLHKMRHPNIVEVNGVFQKKVRGETRMYLQMPHYAGDLVDWLGENPTPDAQQRRKILLGVLRGVARVHEFSFTHNDIKLDNILLDRRNGKLEAVLCDFELLKEETTIASDGTVTHVGGTPAYMAPERSVKGHRPTKASDMFSVGVVILFCFVPSRIKDVTKDAIDATRVPAGTLLAHVRKSLPPQVSDCIDGLLKFNANLRPSARSFLGAPLFPRCSPVSHLLILSHGILLLLQDQQMRKQGSTGTATSAAQTRTGQGTGKILIQAKS
jgi:serine/threonine protein kinase/Ca2+-binding EF-hand superfamily protein